jgi:hypothetical protein
MNGRYIRKIRQEALEIFRSIHMKEVTKNMKGLNQTNRCSLEFERATSQMRTNTFLPA